MIDNGNQSPEELLTEVSHGNSSAAAKLVPILYDELRALAGRYLRGRQGFDTLQPTALVNEAYVKLVDQKAVGCDSKTHFYALAAQAMRWIVADHARKRGADKRGGEWHQVTLEVANFSESGNHAIDLLALEECLVELGKMDERACRIVELRFFAGLSVEETAKYLEVSAGTVKNEWRWTRAWLLKKLTKGQ